MSLLYQTAPVAVAFTGVLDTGKASNYFMISSREITPKHLLLKYTAFYYQLLSFISLYMRAKALYAFSKLR